MKLILTKNGKVQKNIVFRQFVILSSFLSVNCVKSDSKLQNFNVCQKAQIKHSPIQKTSHRILSQRLAIITNTSLHSQDDIQDLFPNLQKDWFQLPQFLLKNKLVNSNGWQLSYNNSLLMIKKCVPLIFKASSSSLSFPRNSTAILAVFSNQIKRNTTKQKINTTEGEPKMKPLNINPILQGASQQKSENKREILSDYDGEDVFSGEQKSYFLAVTSIILLFNLTVRMFIQPHTPFKTYERNI